MRRRTILRWVAIAAAVPSVLLFVGVSAFVARSQYMHDEARCPFGALETRRVSPGGAPAPGPASDADRGRGTERLVQVVEERRSCQDGVEEHRWLVQRQGRGPREIGRRRLMQEHYDGYSWSAVLMDGWVQVHVDNPGVEDAHFREGP